MLKKKHEICKQKCKQIFILIKYENINTKETKKKLYNKIIFQIDVKQTKGNGGFLLLFKPLWELSSKKLP
jgi:hypothetical protein